MTFAQKLKSMRESLGLSQAEAAALLECGKRTLEHWEAGDRVPLAITQEGAFARLRLEKRPRKQKGQNYGNDTRGNPNPVRHRQ